MPELKKKDWSEEERRQLAMASDGFQKAFDALNKKVQKQPLYKWWVKI